MNTNRHKFSSIIIGFSVWVLTNAPVSAFKTANPNASPEAKALIDLYYHITGKYILTGQHNYPLTKDRNSRTATRFFGKTPAVWSSDLGFAKDGDKDSYLARPDIVKEAIRQHRKGSIVTLCWHAVPPTASEPVTFQPVGKSDPGKLLSVQGHLLEEQYKELLTPGTSLYNQWASQVDTVAVYLKQLQDAKVPILWRPYHEMNGDWFWWGGRKDENNTIAIYKQLFDRLVNYHKLNNLVWVWNVDRPLTPVRKFSNFYPGNDYLDILSLDVYGSDFNKAYYDSLLILSKGKPILFGEVGQPPLPDILDQQPLWCSWVVWAGMSKGLTDEHLAMLKDPRVLSQEDAAYWKVMEPYRKACNLPLLPLKDNYTTVKFSGMWILNEIKTGKRSSAPMMMIIDRENEILFLKKYAVMEYGEDNISNDDISLDGIETVVRSNNFTSTTHATWNEINETLNIITNLTRRRGDRTFESKTTEKWALQDNGKTLTIVQITPNGQGGEDTYHLVYDRHD